MRKRIIRKIGNSYYVKLEQTDMKDMGLKVGEFLEVKNINSGCGKPMAMHNGVTICCGDYDDGEIRYCGGNCSPNLKSRSVQKASLGEPNVAKEVSP